MNVDLNNAQIMIINDSQKTTKKYALFYTKKLFRYFDINENNIKINYDYNYVDKKLSCLKGNCENYLNDYEYTLNVVFKLF